MGHIKSLTFWELELVRAGSEKKAFAFPNLTAWQKGSWSATILSIVQPETASLEFISALLLYGLQGLVAAGSDLEAVSHGQQHAYFRYVFHSQLLNFITIYTPSISLTNIITLVSIIIHHTIMAISKLKYKTEILIIVMQNKNMS